MRIITCLLFLLTFSHISLGEDFTVFEKDGRYGLKNQSGVITVPAVHDLLGWSDGSTETFNGVIGFRRNGLWGLISVKNKTLTETKFYTVAPLSDQYIKASVKGRFSNQLFHGLLDANGEILISFNYADLSMKGDHLMAMSFDQLQSKLGIINLSNEVIIPMEYQSIYDQGNFLMAERASKEIDVFYNLKKVAQSLDSVEVENGLIGYRNGKVGFLGSNGQLVHDFEFKSISNENGNPMATRFPNWEIQDDLGEIYKTDGDSVTNLNGIWIAYFNGSQHFEFPSMEVALNEQVLEAATEDKLILRHSKTNEWSVRDLSGKVLLGGQGYIEASGQYFLTLKDKKWHIFNAFGTRISSLSFEEIKQAGDNFFVAKNEKYWGVVDFKGDTYITFKYDSIVSSSANYYAVQFLHKWGITDRHGNWKVNPEFDKIEIFGSLMVAKKESSYSYFDDGQFLFRSTFAVKSFLDEFLLIEDEMGKAGLMNHKGRLVTYPAFDAIRKSGDYLVFQSGDTSAIFSTTTDALIDFTSGYQDFGRVEQPYIPAKRNGRWGFVDIEGRLRISNRYEAVQLFHEGFAAVKLRGKWGFIDENEKLVVQPHYQRVSSFHGNIAVVESKGFWGLINKGGKEVVGTKWIAITRTAYGNYIVSDTKGNTGLVNSQGSFILRPNYDFIQDTDVGIIVRKDGKTGLLEYDGSQIHNLIYSNIKREGEFLMLAK